MKRSFYMSFLKRLPIFSFDFWQKFGKALMVVVAVMPVAGIMISLGKALDMTSSAAFIETTARLLEDMGRAVIVNLPILLTVGIEAAWEKDRAGGAFAALLAFIFVSRITGVLFIVDSSMLVDDEAVVTSLTGSSMTVADYFIDVLGAAA